ncbi:hypothetical protein [Mycolicibacterium sp.]|uniref:hypothetical protein n=1 Tax=Mycolicibacterium sp. TaxID=2320850 RepID=UPI0037C8AF2B
MEDGVTAKIYSDQADVPIYLGDNGDGVVLPIKEKWRIADALAGLVGFLLTAGLVTYNIRNGTGDALTTLVVGLVLTVVAVWAAARIPVGRPSLGARAAWWGSNARPSVVCSHRRR